MDEQAQSVTVPTWFWVAAVLALLFEALGCYLYLAEVMMTDAQIAALPIDQAAGLVARPTWYYAAFAVAVWAGLAGTVLLLLRRTLAVPVLLVSLIAVLVQFSSVILVPAIREVTSSDALLVPIIVSVVSYGIYHLATLARKRGWLR